LALETIRPITADVASVEGMAKFVKVGEATVERPFNAILVKKEGKWLIDSLRHGEMISTPGHYEHLKELEWMIGEWEDVDKDADIRIICAWTAGKNFMTRSFTVTVDGTITHQGIQIVGWDPLQRRIRSWVFDADGTFGEGVWQREGNRWTIKATGVLPGGKRSTATQVITRVDANRYTWQVLARAVDGRPLPNTDETTLVRVATKEKQ